MKISLNWLNDYIDVKDFAAKPEALAQALTGAGLEVEAVENRAKQFAHVVVGQIIELGKHPNADKLTLCQVDTGEKKPHQIVCGAKNHKQGDKVAVALPGAVLPGDFAIKLSKIRDVESQGMLCSEVELGIADKSDGIMILPKDAPVGKPFAEFMGFDDVTFEINVTPNRADCLSHIGIAREIATLFDRELKMPEAKNKPGKKTLKDKVKVEVQDSGENCPRYALRGVLGVKVGPSPQWLKARLEAVGLNSINNVVDVTNYVMFESGQPLHAFDAGTIRGGKILIGPAQKKEKFKTFDGTEFELSGDELTIRDGERAVALAGVIGGLNSGVSETTADIYLETANFNPKTVRQTMRRYGIDTDSGYRFARGTDPDAVVDVMNRACALIQEVAGGEITPDHWDIYKNERKIKPIAVTVEHVSERLGYEVSGKDFSQWMKRLHCDVKGTGGNYKITPPAFRVDLEMAEDLVEEFARLNGYDKIPESFPQLLERPTDHVPAYVLENRIVDWLVGEGYMEARNYGFVSPDWQRKIFDDKFSKLGLDPGGAEVPVRNPLSAETGVMRRSLLPGLMGNLVHNAHHELLHGRLFETGPVFGKSGEEYVEPSRLAIVAWGHRANLRERATHPVVYDVKSLLETLARRLQSKFAFRAIAEADMPGLLHPGQSAALFYEGKIIGFMGTLHPALREEHKIRADVAVCELDLAALMRGQPRSPKIKPISKFPAVERDVALLKPITLEAGEIEREIAKAGGALLQSVQVFDVFRSDKLPEGKESIAFRMVFQDFEGTLTDAKLTELMNSIMAALTKKFDVAIR